jgi:murein L,D-transpeptidase YcbB/YkuD
LQAAIRDLARHAIDGRPFEEMLSAQDPTARELALTRAALAYGDALAHGLVDPATVFEIFALERNEVTIDSSLNAALDAGDLGDWLKGLPPQDAGYQALSKAYIAYLEAAKRPQPPAIPEGEPIKPGASDPRIVQIAQALTANGALDAASPDAPELYGPTLVEAIKRFQNQQGINDDGVIGADTIQVLNAGPTDRARQIALNLETRRWLKRDPAPTRIEVNTASSILYYFKDGKLADSRRVVAGKADAATPLLSGAFDTLIVNPPWNVPEGIAAKEILPKGAGYLRANDMYVKDGRVIQRPGPKASLGRVKFDMQNRYAIYLHDTPSKAAFQANERHGSHGCVRVDGALEFARMLASERGVVRDYDDKLAKGETATVALGSPVPVRLAYHTAFADKDGRIVFRPDVYGWDEKLAAALGLPAPVKRSVPAAKADIGP